MLKREGLNYASKGITHSFCIMNAPVGTYSLETNAYKQSSTGTDAGTVFFNKESSYGPTIPGLIAVFVYEK